MLRRLIMFSMVLSVIRAAMAQDAFPEYNQEFSIPTQQQPSLGPGQVACSVKYITEPIIAAAEAGILLAAPTEGQEVTIDEIIARTDDRDAKYAAEAARYVAKALEKELESEIRIEYSKAQMQVSKVNYDKAVAANQKTPGAIPDIEVRERRFQLKEAQLSLQNTVHERSITEINLAEKQAELQRALAMIERHQVKSPIPGIVAEVEKRKGEYVRPGDPIARLVQLNRVRIAATLDPSEFNINEVEGRSVNIQIGLGGGRMETLQSVISFANPRLDPTGKYEVWAEVDVPAQNLRQGMAGTMEFL